MHSVQASGESELLSKLKQAHQQAKGQVEIVRLKQK